MSTPSDAISTSAHSATLLILLQVSSRGFTFIVNQILLRYLSPSLLGISQQLELFAISVLYFSRESLRVALQRQTTGSMSTKKTGSSTASAQSRRLQGIINLSYLPIALGPVLSALFAWLYLAKASPQSLAVAYLRPSLLLFCIAAVVELSVEPCFAIAAQQQLISLRATAETYATLSRCVVTVAFAIWAARCGSNTGALPFALGQCAYTIALWGVYYGYMLNTDKGDITLLPRRLTGDSEYTFSLLPTQILSLAGNLYAQSGLKHILTQGDALLITLFSDLPSQGIFALASNYGSLLARVVFQPIEESSRSLFGRTLSTPESGATTSKSIAASSPSRANLRTAHAYLTNLLKFYAHLSILLLVLAPPLSGPLLSLLAGRSWTSSSAPRILSKYCHYLPLLAYNGLLEAFVSATASTAELRKQSIAMLIFSGVFATAGYVLLGLLGRGVDGILEANMCNMAVRIIWSMRWVEKWWREARAASSLSEANGTSEEHVISKTKRTSTKSGDDSNAKSREKINSVPSLAILGAETLPHPITMALSIGTWAILRQFSIEAGIRTREIIGRVRVGGFVDVVIDVLVVAVIGGPMLLSMLWFEWELFVEPVLLRVGRLLRSKEVVDGKKDL